jgi:ribosomal-protein-alanine N-acetyltransferase
VSLTVRSMYREDIPAVCAVDRLSFSIPWSEVSFAAEINNTVGYYRVAELDGRIIGYIGGHLVLDEAHLTTFGVYPEYRRRHVGERLLVDFLRYALRCHCRRITLEVRESNEAAQGLYRKYGFTPVSRRPRYYPDNDEDAIVMWIEDTSRAGFRALFGERVDKLEQESGAG